jgi:hypothetical protein
MAKFVGEWVSSLIIGEEQEVKVNGVREGHHFDTLFKRIWHLRKCRCSNLQR